MMRGLLVCLALASAAAAASASAPLGLDYSQYGPYGILGPAYIAADGTGALYTMMPCPANEPSTYCVTKLSVDGATILWQNNLGFAGAMAVDPTGGVYVAGDPNAQYSSLVGAEVVRLYASGGIDFALHVPIVPGAIAVDPTGADVVIAVGAGLARLAPDGVTWLDVTLPQPLLPPFLALAVAANGDAVVYGLGPESTWILQRVDPGGKVLFSNAIPGSNGPISPFWAGLALDAAGNAYITSYSGSALFAVKNSIAPCGTAWLSVFAPDGSILQTTYLPGAGLTVYGGFSPGPSFSGLVAVSSDSSVFVLDSSDGGAGPTRTGPFPASPSGSGGSSAILFHLSPNPSASLAPLACMGNAATLTIGPVAPGELVALYGSGLGPQQGVQPQATLTAPFPAQAAGVEVTFDGTPAPLLWVQDAQINLAVPWSVNGPATKVCVTYNQVQTNCLNWPVAAVSPGVFTTDGVHAAAWNQDGTFNSASNPAPLNSVVSILATGLGPISPAQADGSLVGSPLPVNTLPVQLQCQGITNCPAEITYSTLYAGPAPDEIAGVSQINFYASDAVLDDGLVPLYLAVEMPSALVLGNAFQIYVTGSTTASQADSRSSLAGKNDGAGSPVDSCRRNCQLCADGRPELSVRHGLQRMGPDQPRRLRPRITSDSSGNLYILMSCTGGLDGSGPAACMTKLSADGKTILWQTVLGYPNSVAVGTDGSIYLVAGAEFNLVAQKLASDGTTVDWTTTLGPIQDSSGMAVDSTGRMFVALDGEVVRLNAAGAVDATFTNLPIGSAQLAVDPAGSTVVVTSAGSLVRLTPAGTWTAITLEQPLSVLNAVAVAPNGDVVIFGSSQDGSSFLERIDASGAPVFTLSSPGTAAMALDAAGNTYTVGYSGTYTHAVRNTLAPCGTAWLSVFAPDGSVLQTTYIPGGESGSEFGYSYNGTIAIGPDSSVYVLDLTDGTMPPTQIGPFPEFGAEFDAGVLGPSAALFRLSPNPNAQTFPLACIGSAASLAQGPIAPGELVELLGSGLGPQQGIQTGATPQTPYPTQAGGVTVTFDGEPAPLLWVQDGQINTIVPWSLAGPTTEICVTYNTVATNCLSSAVVEAAPGVFTIDGTHAVALNQDGTLNSAANPAALDSTVTIFATGLGPINPPQADGILEEPPLPVDTLPLELLGGCAIYTGGFARVCIAYDQYPALSAGPVQSSVAGLSRIVINTSDFFKQSFPPQPLSLVVQEASGTAQGNSNEFTIYLAGQ